VGGSDDEDATDSEHDEENRELEARRIRAAARKRKRAARQSGRVSGGDVDGQGEGGPRKRQNAPAGKGKEEEEEGTISDMVVGGDEEEEVKKDTREGQTVEHLARVLEYQASPDYFPGHLQSGTHMAEALAEATLMKTLQWDADEAGVERPILPSPARGRRVPSSMEKVRIQTVSAEMLERLQDFARTVAKEHLGKFLTWAYLPTLAAEEVLKNGTSVVKENAVKVVFRAALRPAVTRGRKGNLTKTFPTMAGSTSSEPGMEEAHRAMIVHVADLDSTVGTLLADLQEMVVRFLRDQGDANIGSKKVYDYTFTFSDGTVFEHTDDSNGDGPGSTIVNAVWRELVWRTL
jgi:hypothetical protein